MSVIYTQAAEVKELARRAFPAYTGNKFKVCAFEGPMRLDSFWEGGSRSYYAVLPMDGGTGAMVAENGTPFSNGGQVERLTELPVNFAVVERQYFCGKDAGITVYVRPENLTRMLPAPVDLTRDQKIVLAATRALKSSYGGVKNYRFSEAASQTGITLQGWDQAKAELITRGLLKSNGAISDEGRNAIGNEELRSLKTTL